MMSQNKNYYIPLEGLVYLSPENGGDLLFNVPEYDPAMYFYLDKIVFSISQSSSGDNGICRITDGKGNVIWEINTTSIGHINLDFGQHGVKMDDFEYGDVNAVVSGAETQATVSVALIAHLDKE